jgi:uncharacterized membrane protein
VTAAWVFAHDNPETLDPAPANPGEKPHSTIIDAETGEKLSPGDIVANRVTREIGSWRFIGLYLVVLLAWMGVNTVAWVNHWDPDPFIFLNLVLSFLGAFAAPITLMRQNRQEERDRLESQGDHAITMLAKREVADLRTRPESLGQALLEEITALREKQGHIAATLDSILMSLYDAGGSGIQAVTTAVNAA